MLVRSMSRRTSLGAGFCAAENGGDQASATKLLKGAQIMSIVDHHGLPFAVSSSAAHQQQGRRLLRYQGRWIVECFFLWLS